MSIKFENVVTPSPEQWRSVVMGARNPFNSWEKSDSEFDVDWIDDSVWPHESGHDDVVLGPNDFDLLKRLRNAGTADHRKFMRMLPVHVTITAPLYWWKEMDQYRIGVTTNSCSSMYQFHKKKFTMDDFSREHLIENESIPTRVYSPKQMMEATVENLNILRELYLKTKDKKYWWQMIQLLPSSYNQKRTVMLNYEVLANIYKSRKGHKLDEWNKLCSWIETLPYNELIMGDSYVSKCED